MPTLQKFTLKNFKGIEEVSIELEGKMHCPVITLIGLNESGKTTILEGLSHFVTGDRSVSGLFDGVHSKTSGAGLIPVHKKAAFSSNIEITGLAYLDEADLNAAEELAKKHKVELDRDLLAEPFEISKRFLFEDSALINTKNIWLFKLHTRVSKKGIFKKYKSPSDEAPNLWLEMVKLIEKRLPQISYFPTFLVDMPSRIYLKEHEGEKAVNRHYRIVFQDILDSLGEGLNLDRHVSNRILEFKEAQQSPNWFSMFFGSASKAPIDSVFQKISNAVTREVIGSWQRVFQRAISAKSIFIEWNIDTEKGDLPYASFQVSDGESRYAISERSLGFRWFFSFLLFTAFKQGKARPTIFIFDEPAANLHAKAQAELLTSFSRIASDGNRIIYSTHSHHMINPRWLSGAYIIENTALDYDTGDSFGLHAKPTNIKATKYRDFLSKYPSRSSYFQPVIEKLEYVSPEVVGAPPFVVVEGISDYYALRLANRLSGRNLPFRLIPGVGSGASGPLISQMMGRGEHFVILLDDDRAGKKEAERYRNEWHLSQEIVLTLAEIDPKFSGMSLEELLGQETIEIVKLYLALDSKPTKRQIGWYLAEACASSKIAPDTISKDALNKLNSVLAFIANRLTKENLEM